MSGRVLAMTSATDMPLKRFRALLAFLAASTSSSSSGVFPSSACCFGGRPRFFFTGVTTSTEKWNKVKV